MKDNFQDKITKLKEDYDKKSNELKQKLMNVRTLEEAIEVNKEMKY